MFSTRFFSFYFHANASFTWVSRQIYTEIVLKTHSCRSCIWLNECVSVRGGYTRNDLMCARVRDAANWIHFTELPQLYWRKIIAIYCVSIRSISIEFCVMSKRTHCVCRNTEKVISIYFSLSFPLSFLVILSIFNATYGPQQFVFVQMKMWTKQQKNN